MLEGLRKGTETVKQRANLNYEDRACLNCGKVFRVKPWRKKKYCCSSCASEHLNNNGVLKQYLQKASEINKQTFAETQDRRYSLILEWLKDHKDEVMNCKMNSLGFLKDLEAYIGVKDARTLAKVLEVSGRKNTVYKLRELIKMYAEL